jgi:hypothetical protein
MMSAAILLAAVGEQTKILSGSADHGNADTPSFASSLAKQFKDSELQIGSASCSSPPASQNLPREAEIKKSEEVGEKLAGLRTERSVLETGVTFEGQKIATADEAATQPVKATVAQSAGNIEGESIVGEGESGATQTSHREVLSAAPAPSDGFAAAPARSPSPRVETSENKPTAAFPISTFVITQAVVEPVGLPKEMITRERAKVGKSEISQKKSPKEVEIDVKGKWSNAGVNTGNVAGCIALVAVPPPAAGDATANNSGKSVNLNPVELLPSAGRSGAGVVSISAGLIARSEAVVGTTSLSDGAQMPANQDFANASPKAGREAEKLGADPIVQLGDGGRAPQREPGSTVPFAHFAAGTVEGIVTATPGIVAAGSPLGNSVTAKVPGGEPSVPSTAVQVPLNEQPGASVLTMPIDGTPRMLSATPNTLEVGIQNGPHGWVRVRAEMTDGGSVNASVSARSLQGQEMLHRELPSLTAYLQLEKVEVNTVVVHAPVQATVEARGSAGLDGGNDQMSRRGSEGGGQRQYAERPASDVPERTMTYRTEGVDEDGLLQIGTHSAGGGWLSVRA